MPTFSPLYLLTVRGTARADTLDARRTLHNRTAGNAEGVAAAKALSDLSHQVFVPCAQSPHGTKANELLFIDRWLNPSGMQTFFSNPDVGKGGEALFSTRDAVLWEPVPETWGIELMAPAGAGRQYVGLLRVAVPSIERAAEVFAEVGRATVASGRSLGLVSHQLYFRSAGTGRPKAELLGVDVWTDQRGAGTHYQATMPKLASAFAGEPDTSMWERGDGFVEW